MISSREEEAFGFRILTKVFLIAKKYFEETNMFQWMEEFVLIDFFHVRLLFIFCL